MRVSVNEVTRGRAVVVTDLSDTDRVVMRLTREADPMWSTNIRLDVLWEHRDKSTQSWSGPHATWQRLGHATLDMRTGEVKP